MGQGILHFLLSNERRGQSQVGVLKVWIIFQRLLEELPGFFKLSRITMHVRQLIRGVGIGRIQLQLTFEFLRRLVGVLR